jgi:DNA-directed RNA polymerase subunit RPC12/RpoP
VPAWRVDSHGLCPKCKRRLLLVGKTDRSGQIAIQPMVLDNDAKASGQTFLIEDHFKELPDLPDKIGFHCPCGFKLFARPGMLDKRGKCPHCGARLLLVGKQNPRTHQLEIHPLVVEEAPSGDTQMFEG